MAWRGWYPIGERFDDEGQSGASVERPGLEKLFAHIQKGDIQRVIVYRLDRLARKLMDWTRLVQLFERFNVGLTVVYGTIDAEGGLARAPPTQHARDLRRVGAEHDPRAPPRSWRVANAIAVSK